MPSLACEECEATPSSRQFKSARPDQLLFQRKINLGEKFGGSASSNASGLPGRRPLPRLAAPFFLVTGFVGPAHLESNENVHELALIADPATDGIVKKDQMGEIGQVQPGAPHFGRPAQLAFHLEAPDLAKESEIRRESERITHRCGTSGRMEPKPLQPGCDGEEP
jgi:hypothetical protein